MSDTRKPPAKPASRPRRSAGSKATKTAPPGAKKAERVYRSVGELRREFYPESDESRSARSWEGTAETVLGVVAPKSTPL